MARLLIVSNRLPVTVWSRNGKLSTTTSMGGLASGMRRPHQRHQGLWFGWPGISMPKFACDAELLTSSLRDQRLIPIELTAEEVESYYERFSNGTLWPAFHYFLSRLPYRRSDFDCYQRVNQRFCDTVVQHYQVGDLIWVHDYHLMLLPRLLRKQLPHARIGFFLHIPFPAFDVFRVIPHHEDLLHGILGSDIIGFHTSWHLQHFSSAVAQVLHARSQHNRLEWNHRSVHFGVFPMGIDAEDIEQRAHALSVENWVQQFHSATRGQVVVGIDRLDYTKGIPRRLEAFERVLETEPALKGRIQFIQVAVPSRSKVEAYQQLRKRIDRKVGEILGKHSTPFWTPLRFICRALTEEELLGLYRVANVMAVTPVRDGMNLVAKEFLAARSDEQGALVLSNLAGSAMELLEAELVNPYDVEAMTQAFLRALSQTPAEQTFRMRALRMSVFEKNVHAWARRFIEALSAPEKMPATHAPS